ncbi:MAG: alkaline phosphatase [Anaerolineales bacterium]|nr:alkaline phosphatase [Anaerolineales bacterium]
MKKTGNIVLIRRTRGLKQCTQKAWFIFLILAILMQGCGAVPNLWGDDQFPINNVATLFPTDTPTATLLPTETITPILAPTETPVNTLIPTEVSPAGKIKHVIIITYDGMRGDAVAAAPMPNLMSMMRDGAYTTTARTINYAVTLPGHASLFSGLCQSKHGVDWDVTTYYKGYSKGVDIFDEAHAAGLKTVMIVNKEKMRQLAEPETTDVFRIVYGTEKVIMNSAIEEIAAGFDLMFIHFGSPDNRGHKYGWMSDAYLKALRDGDAALGLLLPALDQYGIRDSTLIIVTSDHGGHDRGHVGTVIEDLLIPWVAYGPGVKAGQLTNPVSIMDTGPTIAYALELPFQAEWDGFPVYEAFGLPAPAIHGDKICK